MTFSDLLIPGGQRADSVVGDDAVLRALVSAEAEWVRAQADAGVLDPPLAARIASAIEQAEIDPEALASRAEGGGNPVIGLVAMLRRSVAQRVSEEASMAVHRALTSQDVMDTALMSVVSSALAGCHEALGRTGDSLARLSAEHADTVMVARTLGQHALPTTFGARAGRWLDGVAAAYRETDPGHTWLPVSGGGAAGTHCAALALESVAEDSALDMSLGDRLGLFWARRLGLNGPVADQVWHTRRRPMIDAVEPLARAAVACAKMAGDVVISSRNEISELAEPAAEGRGGSSAMAHKKNPTLSILIRRSGVTASRAVGALMESEALAVEERSELAWHLEWEPIRTIARHGLIATSLAAELVEGLIVDPGAMTRNLNLDGNSSASRDTGNSADQARAAARRWDTAKEQS